VPATDLGLVVRARAIVTRAGEQPLHCLSAPSAVVLAAKPPAEPPQPPATPALPAAPDAIAPEVAQVVDRARDDVDTNADAVAPAPAETPAAASAPVVSLNVSSDVLLIGGFAVLAVIAGAAVFGRGES
jgi:hypothetical protein